MTSTFGEYAEAKGKLFATSKDGVRKQVMNDEHAAEWRDTVAKTPKKTPVKGGGRGMDASLKGQQLERLARQIEQEVGNGYPDTDGFDRLMPYVVKNFGVSNHHIGELLDKAVKKHLHAKDFSDYVEQFHKEYEKDNPRLHEDKNMKFDIGRILENICDLNEAESEHQKNTHHLPTSTSHDEWKHKVSKEHPGATFRKAKTSGNTHTAHLTDKHGTEHVVGHHGRNGNEHVIYKKPVNHKSPEHGGGAHINHNFEHKK